MFNDYYSFFLIDTGVTNAFWKKKKKKMKDLHFSWNDMNASFSYYVLYLDISVYILSK